MLEQVSKACAALALVTAPLVGLYFDSRTIGLAAALMSGNLFLNNHQFNGGSRTMQLGLRLIW